VAHLKPQTQTVARHLEEHGSLTAKEARVYGIDRLAARIAELRVVWRVETE